MTSFPMHRLPEELTDLIVYSLNHRPSVYSLCLVSRDFNRIATPHLYSTIALARDDFQHLRPLALLLWTSPKHRALVRKMSVRQAYGGNLAPWPDYADLDELIERQVQMHVSEKEEMKWVTRVRDGSDALPIASLLLRSLPHVVRMEFDGFCLVDPKAKGSDIRF
jgi:hypothetical protein